jgi:hypothetical protein
MSEFEVVPGSLRTAGARAVSIGSRIAGVQGGMSGTAVDEPGATAAGLERFASTWARGVATLADDVRGLGMATDGAAALYEQTDNTAMPGA